jgi:tetratricopeptide (TPR) repeat protein
LLTCALALYGSASPAFASIVESAAHSSAARVPTQVSAYNPSVAFDDCASEPDDAGADDLCNNPVARVLTAPFRALASLFRDDKKDSRRPDAAKSKDAAKTTRSTVNAITSANTPATTPNATNAVRADSANASAANAAIDQPDYAPAPAQPAANTEQPADNPPIVSRRPSAITTPARTADAPFMPLVVGVPNDPISQGRALIGQGLFEEAISELSVAAATGTNLVEANNLLGLAYDHRGQHQRAQEFYQRALTLAPRDAHVINNLGFSLYMDDRDKEALAKLKLAVRLDPSSPEIYNNLGFVYAGLKKYDDAFRSFTQAGGDLYARVRTASLLEAAGRDRDAIKHYEAARKIDPNSTDVLRRLITLYNRTGQRDKAEAAERSLDKPKSRATTSTTD